jgi:hypothetical protein
LRAWRCGRLKHSERRAAGTLSAHPAPPSSFVNTTNRLAFQHYLDECVFRFNRRHTRHAAFDTLLGIGASTNPAPHVVLIHKTAEPGQTTSSLGRRWLRETSASVSASVREVHIGRSRIDGSEPRSTRGTNRRPGPRSHTHAAMRRTSATSWQRQTCHGRPIQYSPRQRESRASS